jgi:hypothetical protein
VTPRRGLALAEIPTGDLVGVDTQPSVSTVVGERRSFEVLLGEQPFGLGDGLVESAAPRRLADHGGLADDLDTPQLRVILTGIDGYRDPGVANDILPPLTPDK